MMKRYTGSHYSKEYFAKFKRHGSLKQRMLSAVDRKEPLFGNLLKLYPKGATLLDYGCGPGWFLSYAEAHFETVGVDFSREALLEAKNNVHQTRLILGNESVLTELKPEHFDVITVFDVLEHVPDPTPLLKSFNRLLKRQGVLALSVPNGRSVLRTALEKNWSCYADPSHIWFLTEQEWRIRLYEAGFTFVKRFSTGLVNYPKPPYSLKGKWLGMHYLTQGLALLRAPLPNRYNDGLLMLFRKIE
jgi:SAM-dependent methyltransferase